MPRKPADWSAQSDAWHALNMMIARYEAEFCGRIIRDAGDAARWRSDAPDGLCWGVIGVAGFDMVVRTPDDLDRLQALFERGVRVFQPIAASGGSLGDDRGLTDLGRAVLARLATLAPTTEAGPRPILDLAGMNAPTAADALRWLDEYHGVLLAMSHETVGYRDLLEDSSPEQQNLRHLRSRGGVIGLTAGLPGCETTDELQRLIEFVATIPFEGRTGYEGIAIGTDFMDVERTAMGLASVRDITRWLGRAFEREVSAAITAGNARRILLQAAGVP